MAVHFWRDEPGILAGQDLQAGGTWLGVTLSGRLAAITNYRDPTERKDFAPSRGHLVRNFLAGDDSPADFAARLTQEGDRYRGFNMLMGDRESLWYYGNRGGPAQAVTPGVHGLSNHLLNTPWPKVRKSRRLVQGLRSRKAGLLTDTLFAALADSETAADDELPDTGVGIDNERWLSPLFITGARYGTRCSSVLLIDDKGSVSFSERRYLQSGPATTEARHQFRLD